MAGPLDKKFLVPHNAAMPIGSFYLPHGTARGWTPKPPELKYEKAPESKEPIVGYRVWNLHEGRLVSCIKKEAWPFRQKMARGTGDLGMGIHAVKDPRRIHDVPPVPNRVVYFPTSGLWDSYKAQVAGSVYLWGEVKEHQEGWLAEFAYPKQLWMPESTDPVTVMQLEQNYGVPVSLTPTLGPHKPTFFDLWSTAPLFFTVTAPPPLTPYLRYIDNSGLDKKQNP